MTGISPWVCVSCLKTRQGYFKKPNQIVGLAASSGTTNIVPLCSRWSLSYARERSWQCVFHVHLGFGDSLPQWPPSCCLLLNMFGSIKCAVSHFLFPTPAPCLGSELALVCGCVHLWTFLILGISLTPFLSKRSLEPYFQWAKREGRFWSSQGKTLGTINWPLIPAIWRQG